MPKYDPNEVVTNESLQSAVDSIMEVLDKIMGNQAKHVKRFDNHDKRFNKLEAGQRELKRQINDLKVDTPTQKEFDELKRRVDRHHPGIPA